MLPAVDDVVLAVLIPLCWVNPSAMCRINITREPLLGHRCVLDDSSHQTTLLNTARAQCVWRCLSSDSCVVVSYNHRLNYCELSLQLCTNIVVDEDFDVNVFGMGREACLFWIHKSQYDPQRAVSFKQKGGSGLKIAVAREPVSTGLYPGKHRLDQSKTYVAVDENIYVVGTSGGILQLNPACLCEWIAYTSSNVLPVGAVQGGYDSTKEPLYVARAKFGGIYSIGYYKSTTLLGYFMISSDVRTNDVMEILVTLWQSFGCWLLKSLACSLGLQKCIWDKIKGILNKINMHCCTI